MTTGGYLSNAWKSKWRAGVFIVLGLTIALGGAACGGAPKTYYYTLQPPATPTPNDPRTEYTLGVEHFRSPVILRDDRILYYISPTQVNYYEHHRWGSDPATLLSEYSARWLESTGVFAEVRMLPVRDRVDYTLTGRLLNFEEVDTGGAPKARVVLELSLIRTIDRKRVWSGEQRQEQPISERGVEGVATALNSASSQVLQAMIPDLLARVEQDFKNRGK